MVSPIKIAVVDDEPYIREMLSMALSQEGYSVECYADGRLAWQALQVQLVDLAIVDVSMPYMDGLELCRLIRTKSSAMPLIFLSSRSEELDKILGLELGADDYITKPFSLRELIVRIKVLRRRLELGQQAQSLEPVKPKSAGLFIDQHAYQAYWNSVLVELTVTEFRLLACLCATPGHVKTRQHLIDAAYSQPTFVEDRTMDSHIRRIRRKFEQVDASFTAIEAVSGLGYRLRL